MRRTLLMKSFVKGQFVLEAEEEIGAVTLVDQIDTGARG